MSDVYIISPCPFCGGMPIVRQSEFTVLGEFEYDVTCEDCHNYSCVAAFSPEQAIKEWEAHCKRETRRRNNNG